MQIGDSRKSEYTRITAYGFSAMQNPITTQTHPVATVIILKSWDQTQMCWPRGVVSEAPFRQCLCS